MLIIYISLIALLIGTFTDFKIREVPDWLSFFCMFAGVGIALINTIIQNQWSFIINSLAGLGFAVALGFLMYYTGQWGGGDSKLLMGLGALIGLEVYNFKTYSILNSFLISFLVNILLVGAVYGIVWVLILAIKNRKKIIKRLKEIRHSNKFTKLRWVFFTFLIIIILMMIFLPNTLIKFYFIGIILFAFLLSYAWLFIKAVEDLAMVKEVDVSKLTEGDWIYKDVKINGKKICGPKDLGISKKQIKTLIDLKKKNKIKTVIIKEGIPFIPSFFIAFILTYFFGNILFLWLL
jgi:Flp pilus assembly protein protease CpaA